MFRHPGGPSSPTPKTSSVPTHNCTYQRAVPALNCAQWNRAVGVSIAIVSFPVLLCVVVVLSYCCVLLHVWIYRSLFTHSTADGPWGVPTVVWGRYK